jgi:hypothetical protein
MSEWLIEGASVVPLEDVIVCGDDYWHDPSVKRLRCPVCHDTYQHTMRTPKPIDAEDNYQAGWGGRSELLLIPVEGVCGHLWEICLGFHKGETFASVRVGAQ